jgi:hypothetical protein
MVSRMARHYLAGTTYAFNGAKAGKFAFEILLVGFIAETRNDQGLEGVATDIGILSRNVW